MPPPPSISAPMRASATNFGVLSRAILELFLAKIFGPWVNHFKVKKGRISKMFTILTERIVFRFFRASSVTIIAMKNLKKAVESS